MILGKFGRKTLSGSFFKNGLGDIGHAFRICFAFFQIEIHQPFRVSQRLCIYIWPLRDQPIPKITETIVATASVDDIGGSPTMARYTPIHAIDCTGFQML